MAELFSVSATYYDRITKVMSFGSGQWYRKQALLRAGCQAGDQLLDVGAGTGSISLLAQDIVGKSGDVVALDPSFEMLRQARLAGVRKSVQGFGEALPFPDQSFDVLTMGYALRHVSDIRSTFSEYYRVIKPGGKLTLLEISRPDTTIGKTILKAYMKGVVPNIARFISRNADAKVLMRYYWDTIESCVPPETIIGALTHAHFTEARRHRILGIFSEYTATKEPKRE